MNKEDIQDIFQEIELDHNVDIYVDGKFKVQIVAYKQENDILNLYKSVIEATERFKYLCDNIDITINIGWVNGDHRQPTLYEINKKSDIEKSEEEFKNLHIYNYVMRHDDGHNYSIDPYFFGFVIYFDTDDNYETITDSKVQKWEEFNLLLESNGYDRVLEIVKDLRDDLELDHKIGYSEISEFKEKSFVKLIIMNSYENDERVIKFNNHLLSRLEWIQDNGESEIKEIHVLLKSMKKHEVPNHLLKHFNDQMRSAIIRLTNSKNTSFHPNTNGDILRYLRSGYVDYISGWWIYFYPPNNLIDESKSNNPKENETFEFIKDLVADLDDDFKLVKNQVKIYGDKYHSSDDTRSLEYLRK